jgi:LuxR family maltose regulon positive regulatory protein
MPVEGSLRTAFDLLESKLAPPPCRPGTVTRSRLVDRLQSVGAAPVVVLSAPVGYGKTTLLASWAESEERPFAWVSIDDRDNDPAVFLTYVAAALDRIEPIDPFVFEALAAPAMSIWSAAMPRLAGAVAGMSVPFVLALDDVQALDDPACLDALAALVAHVPDGSRVVLSSRTAPSLPLARLRAEGRLLEIGTNELRLSVQEAGALLVTAGLDLTAAEVAELTRQTEGWASGLHLAALARQSGGKSVPAAGFGGDDYFVADYFRLELLSKLPAREVEFLTRSSVAESVCGPLCDEMLDRRDSARVLESLERSNLFLVPLDRSRTWYRYHHLFRDLLRLELGLREPELVPELNRRAAAWCAANGELEAAVEYAHTAGDTARVAELVGTLAVPVCSSGRMATAARWLGWFDRGDLLDRYPVVAIAGAWLELMAGRPSEGERRANAAIRAQSRLEDELPGGGDSLEPWIAALRGFTCPDGVERMRADTELAAARLPREDPFRSVALAGLGVSYLLGGDDDSADSALDPAVEEAVENERRDAASLMLAERSLIAWKRGRVADGNAYAEQAYELALGVEGHLVTALAVVVEARAAAHRGDAGRARRLANQAREVRPLLGSGLPWFSTQVCLELARLHVALNDVAGATIVLHEAEEILGRRPDLGVLGKDAADLRDQLATIADSGDGWSRSLTAAELRLLPFLATHLSFREIGERLYISRNTVKTEAISLYRKLSVSSRSEAVERAAALGLLDSTAGTLGRSP